MSQCYCSYCVFNWTPYESVRNCTCFSKQLYFWT